MARREIRNAHERWLGYLRVLEARDAKTTDDRLRELARDVIRPVRLWTARNPNTPPDALIVLSTDPDETVKWNVLLNPSTPLQALQMMADEEAASAPAGWFIVRHKASWLQLRTQVAPASPAPVHCPAALGPANSCRNRCVPSA